MYTQFRNVAMGPEIPVSRPFVWHPCNAEKIRIRYRYYREYVTKLFVCRNWIVYYETRKHSGHVCLEVSSWKSFGEYGRIIGRCMLNWLGLY